MDSRSELKLALNDAANALKWALHYAHLTEEEEDKVLDIAIDNIIDAMAAVEVAKILA